MEANLSKKLISLEGLRLSQWINRGSDTEHCEFHGFADALFVAYAAAVYIRVTSISGEITTTLLASKTKIAPIKPMSISRLELSAAILLSRSHDPNRLSRVLVPALSISSLLLSIAVRQRSYLTRSKYNLYFEL